MNQYATEKLGHLCEVAAGGTPSRAKSEYFGGDVPWVKISDLLQGTVITTDESISRQGLQNSAAKVFPIGTVLISIFATIGRTAVLGVRAATNQAIAGVTPRSPESLDSKYLRHYLDSIVPYLISIARGVAQLNINLGILKDLDIPVPKIAEQRRIASILDQADALRAKRREALAQLDSLTQSIFIEMFGDPATNPKALPRLTLNELMDENGPQNGLYKPSTDYGTGTPILRIDAFYDGVVTKLNSLKRVRLSESELSLYGLRPEDIVINRVNSIEYLGKSALIPKLNEDTVFESNMMRFAVRRDLVEPGFVVQFLQTAFIKSQIMSCSKNAVNQSSINQQDVKSFQVNVPPIALQKIFVNRIQAVETLKSTHMVALAELDTLFASLQHRAFRGEL